MSQNDIKFVEKVIVDLFVFLDKKLLLVSVKDRGRELRVSFFVGDKMYGISLEHDDYDKAMFGDKGLSLTQQNNQRKSFIVNCILDFLVRNFYPELYYLMELEANV